MARPVEFEYDKVLNNAMEQFWKEGYEASSVQKLLDCTGINRGTLYNSFGDKDTFFKSCVEQYNKVIDSNINQTLGDAALAPWDAIARYFDLALVNAPARHRVMGCLLVNSVCESINYDKQMKKLVRDSLATLRKGFVNRLKEAHKKGKIKKDVSVELAADILMNSLHGLRVNARDGKTPKQLAELVNFTLDSLRRK